MVDDMIKLIVYFLRYQPNEATRFEMSASVVWSTFDTLS